uniref:Uncharacterized protein n=1 Tax=Anguilla anguilla TaxID=7936 RepID=A0A0E9PRK9_ANGAN
MHTILARALLHVCRLNNLRPSCNRNLPQQYSPQARKSDECTDMPFECNAHFPNCSI